MGLATSGADDALDASNESDAASLQARPRQMLDEIYNADQKALEKPARCCGCGAELDPSIAVIKRGALTIERDAFFVAWRGQQIALSPTETQMLATIACRGFASYRSLSDCLEERGLSPRTRDVLLHRIRRKFIAAGAPVPFQRCGDAGLRLLVQADETGSTATVIGLRNGFSTFTAASAMEQGRRGYLSASSVAGRVSAMAGPRGIVKQLRGDNCSLGTVSPVASRPQG